MQISRVRIENDTQVLFTGLRNGELIDFSSSAISNIEVKIVDYGFATHQGYKGDTTLVSSFAVDGTNIVATILAEDMKTGLYRIVVSWDEVYEGSPKHFEADKKVFEAVHFTDETYIPGGEVQQIPVTLDAKVGIINYDGSGSITLVQTTGNRTDVAMSQAAVTNELNKINNVLYPTTATLTTASTLYVIGSTPTVVLNWTLKRDGVNVTPDSITLNGTAVTGTSAAVNPTTTTAYKLIQTKDGIQYESNITISFSNNNYYGVLTAATPTAAQVQALTAVLDSNRAYNATYTGTQTRAVYAYPASYGNLTSALDPNGFQNIGAFTRTQVNIVNAAGTTVAYNVYTAQLISNYEGFTFRFS